MNRRGQALIEFVLILPIFIFLLLIIFDFGMIFTRKSKLETISSDVINLYKSGKSLDEIRLLYPDNEITNVISGEYNHITVKDNVKIYTPGLNLILGNPYEIMVERYIPYE